MTSLLESRRFSEKRMRLQKNRRILAAYNCDCGDRPRLLTESRFEGDEEIEPVLECGVLDVQTGVWSKLSPPPHVVNPGSKSVCVNGSIYWLHVDVYVEKHYKILALDLHKQEFNKFSVPPTRATKESRLVNLEERLAFVKTNVLPIWRIEIWSTDTYQKRWSKTFSIHLKLDVVSWPKRRRWFTPVAISKQGNLVFYDNQNKLFKYYPRTNETRCLSVDTCVISPYMENLVSLPLKPSHPYPHVSVETRMSRCRLFSKESSSWIFKALQRCFSSLLSSN
ncbi:hypothetical protein HID58_017054 [Brassica napus]|uniref:F-box associated beta-propeller type 1 domain-containing protein n=1 Tax=Brassica napus TaxID=3708 RepID=A0ABQ8D6C2_BRANA|nr:hypothetical protein HID58_017054 [Brassica napus]